MCLNLIFKEEFSSENRGLQLPEERNPMRRSISSSGRLCRQYSQENRDDIQLTIKSPSFESALVNRSLRLSKSHQHKSFPEGIDFGDGKRGTVVAINGPIENIETDRALFEAQESQEGVKVKVPQNSMEGNLKSNDTYLDSPVFHHKRVNSAQRRKDFATSVRRAKQIMNQEGSIHSSGSQCRSCSSWCSVGSFHSETHRDSITSCHTCSPRLLSSKESGFSRSMDYDSIELARSRKCSRCSLESDETGLGGMDFHSSRNSETMSLGSHRHIHHLHHHHRHGHTSKYHHKHRHRHHRHRTTSSSSYNKSRHSSTGYSYRSSRDVSSLSVDYPDDDTFRYYSSSGSQHIHRSESRSSRRSERSSGKSHHEHREHREHRDHRDKESKRAKAHKKLSRASSDWVDRLSVGNTSPRGEHGDYDMYNGHMPLEQTRSDTSNEMHYSPKPRIYKVKSLDLKPQGHYRKSADSSPINEPEVPLPRRPRHKSETDRRRNRVSRVKSPSDVSRHFIDPAEVIKRKAIQTIEAEIEKHNSSMHVPSAAESIVLNSEEQRICSDNVLDKSDVVRHKTYRDKFSRKHDKVSMSVDHGAERPQSLHESGSRRGSAPNIELIMRTPSGHFQQVSLDDDRFSEPDFIGNGYTSSYDTSPELPFPSKPSYITSSNRYHSSSRRAYSLQNSRNVSLRSSREHSRSSSPNYNKNPMRDSAYQSKEQSTEKANSKPGSKSVSPTISNGLSGKLTVGRARDDSGVHYTSKSTR